jgi:Fe-S-cluster containining protein
MPHGKPAGIRCRQLDNENLCKVFGQEERPGICRSFTPTYDGCGSNREEAMLALAELEMLTG